MPLRVFGGGLWPSMISIYSFLLKVILPKLGDTIRSNRPIRAT